MRPTLDVVQEAARKAVPLARFGLARVTGRKFPLMVTMSVTDRCNFRCTYCELPALDRDEMTTAEWLGAIDEFADHGMSRVSLMGGEPLVRKDIGALLRRLKERGVNVAMNTNGWLVPQRLDELAGLDLACVTLDGPPAVHDVQRHPGSYERALKAIDLLRGRGVAVVTMTVLTPQGARTIDHVLEVARATGALAYFQLVHDSQADLTKEIGAGIDDAGVASIARHLLRRKEEGWPVGPSRSFLRAMLGDGERGRRQLERCDDCLASRYFISITPAGRVIPCPLTYRGDPPDGRRVGWMQAFESLSQPTGQGCGCYPTKELNNVLRGDPDVIFNALSAVLKQRQPEGPLPPLGPGDQAPPRRRLPLAEAESLAGRNAEGPGAATD